MATQIHEVQRKTRWVVCDRAPKKAGDLSFTSRDHEGCFVWWDVTPPNTDYCHAHEMLGRAHAFEFLDLMNNPEREEEVSDMTLQFVVRDMVRKASTHRDTSVMDGFFHVLGEYLMRGSANR